MSMESAIAFYEKLESDLEFAKSFEGKTAEEVEKFVKVELGYDFTREEMQKVVFERNPEMTDEELEAVVGGIDVVPLIAVPVLTVVTGGLIIVGAASAAA